MKESKRMYALTDLHLHLDGSLSVDSVRKLARMQKIAIPQNDDALMKQLQVSPNCKDLNEYLEKFDFPCKLLQTPEAISTAVSTLLEELRIQGLLYAEIRFAPQLHTVKGLSQQEVVEAAIDGLAQSDVPANLILCCMRGADNQKQNYETLDLTAAYLGKGVCAADLAGAEALFPTSNFKDLFHHANAIDIPYTIHAGEAAGPESVSAALDLGAKRLGHGVRSVEDPSLLRRLAAEGIALELCPTSNLNTHIFPNIQSYPLPALMDAGVKVTVNTDNMTVSGVSIQSEWELLIQTFSLTNDQIRTLQRNAVDVCFADPETKNRINSKLDVP